jgi:Ca2+-binding EF-hand superfamily protein
MASQNKSKTKTNKIVERNKIQQFMNIFQKLDSDGDGQISAYRIDITSLDPELLQVLSPLFVEMEELGMNLDQEEFIDAASRLYETVSLPDKNKLVNRSERTRSGSARGQERKK